MACDKKKVRPRLIAFVRCVCSSAQWYKLSVSILLMITEYYSSRRVRVRVCIFLHTLSPCIIDCEVIYKQVCVVHENKIRVTIIARRLAQG